MKLSLDSFYRSALELVDKTPLRRLTEQQKKIALIASLALSLLAAAYLIYRCCFKATKDSELPNQKRGICGRNCSKVLTRRQKNLSKRMSLFNRKSLKGKPRTNRLELKTRSKIKSCQQHSQKWM